MELLKKLKLNPNNPRTIGKNEFERLKTKIKEFPEMLEKRPIVYDEEYIILGGNMRFRALQELSNTGFEIKETYFVNAKGWTEKQKKQFIINDNISEGSWDYDLLGNQWDDLPLKEWGIELKGLDEDYSQKIGEVVYEPKETNHAVSDLFEVEHKFDEDIAKIQNKELQELFKARAYNFTQFNFEKLADYYAYQATPEEQRVFEKLALVLLDKDQLIENGFSKLVWEVDSDKKDYENKS